MVVYASRQGVQSADSIPGERKVKEEEEEENREKEGDSPVVWPGAVFVWCELHQG